MLRSEATRKVRPPEMTKMVFLRKVVTHTHTQTSNLSFPYVLDLIQGIPLDIVFAIKVVSPILKLQIGASHMCSI